MIVEAIWDAHSSGAALVDLRALAGNGEEYFYLAVLAHSKGDVDSARALAREAVRLDPDRAVFVETARYLAGEHEENDPYASSEPFTAFARGGGNVGLYRAAHEALRSCYAAQAGIRLLDIGTGEGHGLLPALTDDVSEVDVVEPSQERLALVSAELERRGLTHRAHVGTVQDFTTRTDVGPWDLVQETFALLTLTRAERIELFTWLRPMTKQLAFIEFDVPALGSGLQPGWFRYLIARYERGIREYDEDRHLVAQGFMVPVLLSTLGDDGGPVHTEQPIEQWVADLESTRFTPERPRQIYDYWWAPAHLIRAT